MAIHYACSYCKKRMKSPDRFAGSRVTCPACDTELIVPEKSAQAPKAEVKWDPSQRQSTVETGDYESEAEAVRRELDETES
jgi:hypothetical protein